MTVVSLLLAVLLAEAKTPPDEADEVQQSVEKWIQQLDAPSLLERSQAERELLDLGPKILRWLPPKELIRGSSARDAVPRIRTQLQRRLARDSAQASRVTLDGEFALPELLAEIQRQTANPIRLGENVAASSLGSRPWTFEKTTFWDAIDAVCRETHLVPGSQPEADAVILSPQPDDSETRVICRAGVLRAEIVQAQRQPVTGDPARSLLRLKGDLAFEPRLRPLFVHFQAADFTATGDDGETIDCWNPAARYELPMAGASRRTQLTWDFVAPTKSVPQKIAVKGRLLVQLAAATEPVRFDELATNREVLRRRGGVSVRLHQVEFTDDTAASRSARVKISVNYDAGGPAFESHRTWVYHNAAWLEHDGRRIPFADFEALQHTNGGVQLEYHFRDVPRLDTLKFVYEAPTLLLDVPFDLDFANVPVE